MRAGASRWAGRLTVGIGVPTNVSQLESRGESRFALVPRAGEAYKRTNTGVIQLAPMKFACPQCGQHLDGEAGYAGRTINCPACGYGFAVPSAASVRPLAAAPAVRRVPQAPSHAARPRTSPLAIWSLVLSLATMVLGPF